MSTSPLSFLSPLREARQFLLPERCVVCGSWLLHACEGSYPLCSGCEMLLRGELISGPRCRVCGRPLIGEIEVCTACRERGFAFTAVYPLGLYTGTLAAVLRAYKLEGCRTLAVLFADLLLPVLAARTGGELLVRVPSSAASVRRRGWDHTAEICRILGQRGRFRFLPLLRRRRSRAQKSLDFAARSSNLRGKIVAAGGQELRGARVLCFDDVLTTGATLHACAQALMDRGAGEVRAVVIAADP